MTAFTFFDLLSHNLPSRSDHALVVDGQRLSTYAQISGRVEATAAWLLEAGVRPGDRVGVHLRKSSEEIVAMFASAKVGAAFVNINHQWTLAQLDYVLRDCDVSVLFADARPAHAMVEADLPNTLRHIVVHGKCPDHARVVAWTDLPIEAQAAPVAREDDDLAAILYTSGSSGQPKGVMLSNRNLVEGARSVSTYLENVAADRLLSLLPFSFDYGLSQLTTMCLVGGTVVLQPVMMAAEIVKTLAAERITGFAAVPPAWISVVRFLAEQPTELPTLRYITNSGGKIPDNILQQMPEVFPGVKIFLMYGLTEAFRSTYLPPELFAHKRGSMGLAIPGAETYIIDPQIGVCGPGQQGELVHRGALISQGYWGKPEDTAEKIKPCPELAHMIGDEKVLYSGDIVRIDDDGYFWFVGRNDAMIKSSGFRISPTEVEDIVSKSGLVSHVVAFGVPSDELGEVVVIAVTATGDDTLEEEALMRYCRAEMPHYMVPSRIHHWQGEFPRTGSGKIDRPQVKQDYVES